MVVMRLGGRAKMLEATCAVPQYRRLVKCDNQGPGKRTAPQPWEQRNQPHVLEEPRRAIIWLIR